jgi:hypothetical protein
MTALYINTPFSKNQNSKLEEDENYSVTSNAIDR